MATNPSDTPAWTVDTPTETLWAAVDELRQRRQTLLTSHRNDRRNYKQRFEMYRKQLASNPAMRSNAEMQIQMMNQQKDFAKENLEREMDKVVNQIETIERLVDQQKLRASGASLPSAASSSSGDSAQLKASIDRLSMQWGELRSEVNIFKSVFARQLDELRQVVATLQK